MTEPWSYEAVLELIRAEGVDGLRRHAEHYLVKAPSTGASEPDPIGFRTAHVDQARPVETIAGWVIRPLRKREGNPWPERFSIGRAPNCDVVLRLKFVSKLHAHVHRAGDGTLSLSDNGSANGTWVDDVPLPPGERVPIAEGSELRFGSLTTTLTTPAALVTRLAARASD